MTIVESSLRREIQEFQSRLLHAEGTSATSPPGMRDFKAAAISHYGEMIRQRQGILERLDDMRP
jgi:hypothetical protein